MSTEPIPIELAKHLETYGPYSNINCTSIAAATELRRLHSENKALKAQVQSNADSTYNYARYLAETLFKEHFASDEHYASGKIVWEVCDTTGGILTQIDNMVSGMVRKSELQNEPTAWRLKNNRFDYHVTAYDKEQASAYTKAGWELVGVLYASPQTLQKPVTLETIYETIVRWDESGGKRSRRDLARKILALYVSPSQPQQELVDNEGQCTKCGFLKEHTEHIGCLREALNAINFFEQRHFAIVDMEASPQPQSQSLIDKMRKMLEVQGRDGNWDDDPYMHGMYNGMEYMLSMVEDREPNFRKAPIKWMYTDTDTTKEKSLTSTECPTSDHTENVLGMDNGSTQHQPLTDGQVAAAARALNDLCAEACGVDKDDYWMLYSEYCKRDALAVLEAAHGIGSET